jgi:alcohol dehydrogenase class IV
MLRRGADFLSQKRLSRIVAIGGGSVLDWCRLSWAVSRGLLRLGDSRLHQEATVEEHPEFWLIPSTCGTGAEAATVAVYNSENGAKVPVVSQAFLASHVILDGQFLTSVRSGSLECSLSDALSHAIESFVSIVPCGIAKESAVSALWLILENYELPVSTSRNDKLMEAGFLGGLSASHCSVGVVHAFAHTVARDGIAHGHGNALGLIPGILTNAETPAMQLLLKRCALPSVRDLLQRVRPIVEKAIAARPTEHLMRQLRDSAGRAALRDRMTKDVCMRSNPRPLAAGDIDQFLDRVLEIAGSI